MRHFIIWYMDEGISKEGHEGAYEDYTIIQAKDINEAWKMANEMFGDYVVSVEPYNP